MEIFQRLISWGLWVIMLGLHFFYLLVVLAHPVPFNPSWTLTSSYATAAVLGLLSLGLLTFMVGSNRLKAWAEHYYEEKKSEAEATTRIQLRYFNLSVLGWSLANAVSLMGLILFHLGQIDLAQFLIFFTVGLSLHILGWPEWRRVREALQEFYEK